MPSVASSARLAASDGAGALSRVQALVSARRARLRLAHVKPAVAAVLERDGVLDAIGPAYVHGDIEQALLAERRLRDGAAAGP